MITLIAPLRSLFNAASNASRLCSKGNRCVMSGSTWTRPDSRTPFAVIRSMAVWKSAYSELAEVVIVRSPESHLASKAISSDLDTKTTNRPPRANIRSPSR